MRRSICRFAVVPVCRCAALAFAVAFIAAGGAVLASDCTRTSTGLIPINDLGPGLYLGQFQGGLYPGGLNTVPSNHAAVGASRASQIVPRDTAGNPSSTGKVVLLSIGMSNTTQEFCGGNSPPNSNCESFSFIGQAAASSAVNHTTLAIVDGAIGGQAAPAWTSPTFTTYNTVRTRLTSAGLSEAQVQAIWLKQADASPSVHLPSASADAYPLEFNLGNIARACKVRYPNLQIIYLSSRIYAGYATSNLNPEPYAYESGFSVKWLIQAQINQENGGGVDPVAGDLGASIAPWLVWGPYLWADGASARSDGLTWACSDFNSGDGTHPATGARTKVGGMILSELLASPFAANWFRASAPPCPADVDHDGQITPADVALFVNSWFTSLQTGTLAGDFNGDGAVTPADLAVFVNAWFSALVNGC